MKEFYVERSRCAFSRRGSLSATGRISSDLHDVVVKLMKRIRLDPNSTPAPAVPCELVQPHLPLESGERGAVLGTVGPTITNDFR